MVNEIIDGKYEILEKIGSGGTSIVYKARRLADERIVAIKIIRDELENIRELERRFRLEAEALNKMSHRNIRRILSVGQWNDSLYMVTEFIDGRTLKDIVSEGPVSVKTAVDYALQIAAGIEHAHRKDIIHRDIKPQNIIVANDGTVKLVDFGIARMTSQTTRTMAAKDVVGSVHYLSPEQARGGVELDGRSDIYSFGILLYEMFTGKVPFEGSEPVGIAMQHINQIPEQPQRVNPNIPKGINDIIVKCIKKNPAQRYQSATELREDLLLYVANPEGFSVVNNDFDDVDNDENDDFEPVNHKRIHSGTPNNVKIKKKVSYISDEDKRNARASKSRRSVAIILGIVASVAILAVAISIMASVLIKKEYPDGEVPSVNGKRYDTAVGLLNMSDFTKYVRIYEESSTVPENCVIRTEPEQGSVVKVNTEIKIYVSKGAKKIMAQNTIGMTFEDAERVLIEQGFVVTRVDREGDDKDNGKVVAQSEYSEALEQGSTITLTVVNNIETIKITVPDLSGMIDVEAIKKAITDSGCTVGIINEMNVTDPDKIGVIWQSVVAGEEYIYKKGDAHEPIVIDVDINVIKVSYEIIYEYEAIDGVYTDFELVVYDINGNQIGDSLVFNSANRVYYRYQCQGEETVTFELYNNHRLLEKKTMTAVQETANE